LAVAILNGMATLDPQTVPLTPQTPTSVQPGGLGFFGRLEEGWGRWRRAWLRRFRPGHVRRMAALRQGHCPDCPHDVVDPRDLKYVRNVCGYYFRREDDPYDYRNRLRLARYGLAELVGFSTIFFVAAVVLVGAAAVLPPVFAWVLYPLLLLDVILAVFVVRFFRDPPRATPDDPHALVSPADGTVTDVGEVEDPDFPGGRAFRVSIFLSVFNVHVNRVPRSGRVVQVRYFRGRFLDARHPECAARNEQLWLDLEEFGSGQLLRVKQISGAIARRIVCWLKVGEEVRAGERFGMIKFGSRTDVLLPVREDVEVRVKVGDKVQGGSTVLLRYQRETASG
jgi:phosphatidylserine decarboxylase